MPALIRHAILPPLRLRPLAILLLVLCLPATAAAQDFSLGLAASQQGDYRLAGRIWYPLAEAGDPRSQFGLGTLFHEGLGVEVDYTESAYWFHRAAEQGLAEAQYNLGNAYKNGEGVGQSDPMAVLWWRRSAEQGFAPAQYNLGTAYRYGRGVPADADQALDWFGKAAEQGHSMARQVLQSLSLAPAPVDTAPPPGDCDQWLASGARYTIQFMASRERADAEAFAGRLRLEGPVLVCSYLREGQTWHAVLWGRHGSLEDARRAVAELPAALRDGDPWIRTLSSLRKARAGATP